MARENLIRVKSAVTKADEPGAPPATGATPHRFHVGSTPRCPHIWKECQVLVEVFGDETVNKICKLCRMPCPSTNPNINQDAKLSVGNNLTPYGTNPIPPIPATITIADALEEIHQYPAEGTL